MKKLYMTLLFAGLLMLSFISPSAFAGNEVIVIDIKGMTCQFCAYNIRKKILELPNIAKVQVSLKHRKTRIVMSEGVKGNIPAIKNAIKNAGYTTGGIKVIAAQ